MEMMKTSIAAMTAAIPQFLGAEDVAPEWLLVFLFGIFVAIDLAKKFDLLKKLGGPKNGDRATEHLREVHAKVHQIHGLMTFRGESGIERFIRHDQALAELAAQGKQFERTANLIMEELKMFREQLNGIEERLP